MNKVVKKRESNFELLRIVSMLFIILHHFVYYSDYQIGQVVNLNDFVLIFFKSGGKLGVILFVMITGYYKIKSKESKYSKLVGLELQVLFYSLGIFIFVMIFGNRAFLWTEFSKLLLPNVSKTYWFFSSYFILYLFIPFLNKLVDNLSKKEFERLLIIGFVFLVLVPSIVIYNRGITEGIYLYFYYLVGGYIRLYWDDIKGNIMYLLCSLFSYVFVVVMTMVIANLSYSNSVLVEYVNFFSRISSILIFVSAISLFLFFKGLKLGDNSLINGVASVSFGVYLFHEHMYVKEFLWQKLFNVGQMLSSANIFVVGIVGAILIYLVGGIIELLRQMIFKCFYRIIKVDKNKVLN